MLKDERMQQHMPTLHGSKSEQAFKFKHDTEEPLLTEIDQWHKQPNIIIQKSTNRRFA